MNKLFFILLSFFCTFKALSQELPTLNFDILQTISEISFENITNSVNEVADEYDELLELQERYDAYKLDFEKQLEKLHGISPSKAKEPYIELTLRYAHMQEFYTWTFEPKIERLVDKLEVQKSLFIELKKEYERLNQDEDVRNIEDMIIECGELISVSNRIIDLAYSGVEQAYIMHRKIKYAFKRYPWIHITL